MSGSEMMKISDLNSSYYQIKEVYSVNDTSRIIKVWFPLGVNSSQFELIFWS